MLTFSRSSWLAHALASLLGGGLGFALTLSVLDAVSGAEPMHFGGGGGVARAITCPPAHFVVGARIFTRDDMVAGVSLLCVRSHDAATRETETLGTRAGAGTLVRCDGQDVAVGIWGAAGTLVDQLSLSCAARARVSGPSVHLAGVGGKGGQGFHVRCAGRLHGLTGAAGAFVDRVAALCESHDSLSRRGDDG